MCVRRDVCVCVWLAIVAVFVGPGCAQEATPGSPKRADGASVPQPRDDWDLVFLQNARVGFAHSTRRVIRSDGHPLVHTETDMHLTLTRFGQSLPMRVTEHAYETLDGRLRRTAVITRSSQMAMEMDGRVEGDHLRLVQTIGKHQSTNRIPWSDDIRGPYAMERTMRRKPLTPGTTYRMTTFDPALGKVTDAIVTGRGTESVDVLGRKRRLWRAEVTFSAKELQNVKITVWLDDQRETVKTHIAMMGGLVLVRTTREQALAPILGQTPDLALGTLVKVSKPIPAPLETHEAEFLLWLSDGSSPRELFVQDASQQVLQSDAKHMVLRVRRVLPVRAPAHPQANRVAREYLDPCPLIQSDDDAIRAVAKEVAGSDTAPWPIAQRLEKWVRRNITTKGFKVGFASAAEVIKRREGDCSEHAVLLAALARAAGIPARVAIGLVYLQGTTGFAYHMWTEVFIDRWVGLDATVGLGHISACHIKIRHSSLRDASAMSVFLPTVRLIGRLRLKVMHVKHP